MADQSSVTALERLQVVSTATRTERLLSEVPIRTEVVTQEDMHMRGTFNFSQAVELFNGVRVESTCQNCNTSEVLMLGLGGAYNQILFDGAPLMSALGGVYGLEQIPTAFVDRIEIVKGGSSALYGAGAVSGVINLVPIQPLRNGGFLQAGVDVQKGEPIWLADGRLDRVFAGGKGGLSLVFQSSQNDPIDYDGDDYSEITEKELGVVGAQVWFAPTAKTRLRANYQYTWEERRGGNRFDQPEYLANIAESLQTKYHRGGVSWEQDVTADFDFSIGYSFAYIERDSFYGGLGDVVTDPNAPGYDPDELDPTIAGSAASDSFGQYGYTEDPLHYIDSQFNYRLEKHAFAAGIQYKWEKVRDYNRDFLGKTLATFVDDSFSNVGFYLQDEWTATPTLSVVLGGRVDKSSELDDAIFSPRVALAYEATPTLKLRASVATGFRAPGVFDEDLHVDTLGADQIRIRNDAALKEEQTITGMVGLEWRNDPANATWGFDVTASLTDIDDTFLLGPTLTDPVTGDLYQVRSNASGSRVEGVEANWVYIPNSQLRFELGAAYFQSRYDEAEDIFDDTDVGGTTIISTRDYLITPEWSGVAQAIWTPMPEFNVFLGVKYVGAMDALHNRLGELRRTPDFWVVDFGFTRHFDTGKHHIDVTLGVKNLFDERQKDLERGADRDNDYVYGPRFARSFFITAKYLF
ncbi:TonB-dependent receptor [Cephaloticoccus capnophilus]|uniref:TonB-dependent receptor n=1 Tax=Cephaloticoccus capnophilus TaxID=1548208 RepID=A0A139SS04_9BACT|nr:TonB-dependent receptor [Cephaloticoccus capnophilus]